MAWRIDSIGRVPILLLALGGSVLAEGTLRVNTDVVASATASVRPATRPSAVIFLPLPRNSAVDADVARNEQAIIDFCFAYVDAQLKYFQTSQNSKGVLVFAQKIRSTPGKRDGLYWPLKDGDYESPFGPNIGMAAITELQRQDQPRPFWGYYFKTLLSQGLAGRGGARDYRVDGLMLTGFALIAWPAEYGVTGVHSFLVSHLGDVYAKDLGPNTSHIATEWATFNPDGTWKKVASMNQER